MPKKYVLANDELESLAPGYGTAVASDQVTVSGRPIGYMYREDPTDDGDSGWRFLSGDETQEYLDDDSHIGVFDVNEIANFDDAIVDYLDAEPGTRLVRIDDTDDFADADDDDDEFDDDSVEDWEEFDVDAVDAIDDLRDDDRL